jgi:hypothetical protein
VRRGGLLDPRGSSCTICSGGRNRGSLGSLDVIGNQRDAKQANLCFELFESSDHRDPGFLEDLFCQFSLREDGLSESYKALMKSIDEYGECLLVPSA